MHDHAPSSTARALDRIFWITLALNLFIPAAQIIGGVLANSTALIADALHNFTDFAALLLAFLAFRWSRKPASARHTFGFHRFEVLAAFVNVLVLLGISLYILFQGVNRLLSNQPLISEIVIVMALLGIAANGLSAYLLHGHSRGNLNVRAAFLHLLTDTLTSVGVLLVGLIILFRPWYWLDGMVSLGIGLVIGASSVKLLKKSLSTLLNGVPESLDLDQVRASVMQAFPSIENIRHIHAWEINPRVISFTAYITLKDQPLSQVDQLSTKIKDLLLREFGINHAVLQFEALGHHPPGTTNHYGDCCVQADLAHHH
ncbi:MAG TPA: cation transporter [Desulfonatronum sp.]|nr:cation transporter [Desulfonatronum sp.]